MPCCIVFMSTEAFIFCIVAEEAEGDVTVCACSPTGRLSGAAELGRVREPLAGGGGVCQGHGGAVRQAQRLPEGGAAQPGQPLRPPLPRRAQDQTQVCCRCVSGASYWCPLLCI